MNARGPRAHRVPPQKGWHGSRERSSLLALYAEVDALLADWSCRCSCSVRSASDVDCCHFAVTGREPYPTAVELEEVRHTMRALSVVPRRSPLADMRRCPLLSAQGRCRIYASRPFGCRTFFCEQAESTSSPRPPREAVQAVGRRIADLSERFAPVDPHPRSLVRALSSTRD